MELSIITATYNSASTLAETCESILNQTIKDFEYIIIDGNSKDDTKNIISKYEKLFQDSGIKFKWISEKDSGIYEAWNKGIVLSTGNWVSFLGSDDIYLNDAIELYLRKILSFSENNKCDFVYSNVKVINSEKKVVKLINGTWTWSKFKNYMNLAHVGSFHNKDYFRKYGTFDESYRISGDYELLLRANKNLKSSKINQVTALMSNSGVSNGSPSNAFNETFRAKRLTGKVSLVNCIFHYILSYIKFFIRKFINEALR